MTKRVNPWVDADCEPEEAGKYEVTLDIPPRLLKMSSIQRADFDPARRGGGKRGKWRGIAVYTRDAITHYRVPLRVSGE